MDDAGPFSAWLDGMLAALHGEVDADVPCGSCTACCTSSQFVHIAPDEHGALARIPSELRFPAPGLPEGHVVLPYDERGHCPMLVDGACSIYDDRPRTCRTYDCRVFTAAGVEPDRETQPAIAERVARWQFTVDGSAAQARADAVRDAAAYLDEHGTELVPERAPVNRTQLAVLAVEVHDAFLGPDAPEPAVVAAAVDRVRRWRRYGARVAAKKDEDALELEVAGHELRVTHPEKVFFGKIGATKQDLLDYYLAIGEPIMRSMGGRPVLLQRFPNGVGGNSFFQKRIPESAPEWLETTTVSTPNGTESRALVIGDLGHVVWAMNMGCLGFHVWPVLAADPEHTDELRIDLDPQPGVTFDQVREAAHEVKRLLDDVGLTGWPKTTGSRGLHVYVQLEPRWDSYDVRYAAVAVARELARRRPELITDAWWKEERGERVFIDFNQNAPHKTVFGAWSVRSRVMGPVSTPITWDEIDTVQPDELTLFAVPERVATAGDPWAAKPETAQSLEPLLALHEQDRANGLLDAPWPPEYPKRDDEPTRVAPSRAKKTD